MALETARLDVRTMPELARLVDEVAQSGRPLVLQDGDREIAVLMPAVQRARKRRKSRILTPAQREAFLASAGGWAGIMDVEQFKRDIKTARSDRRPPVTL